MRIQYPEHILYLAVRSTVYGYLVIDEGWIDHKRTHTLIFDAEIRNHKIWLHHDGLDHGITDDLIAAGIPKDQIVLAFHPPDIRPHTGYAIA